MYHGENGVGPICVLEMSRSRSRGILIHIFQTLGKSGSVFPQPIVLDFFHL